MRRQLLIQRPGADAGPTPATPIHRTTSFGRELQFSLASAGGRAHSGPPRLPRPVGWPPTPRGVDPSPLTRYASPVAGVRQHPPSPAAGAVLSPSRVRGLRRSVSDGGWAD